MTPTLSFFRLLAERYSGTPLRLASDFVQAPAQVVGHDEELLACDDTSLRFWSFSLICTFLDAWSASVSRPYTFTETPVTKAPGTGSSKNVSK
jgi:hypothetical protein